MLTFINRLSKYSIVILGFLAITLSYAQEDRADDISILDVDANGQVDALTESWYGLKLTPTQNAYL